MLNIAVWIDSFSDSSILTKELSQDNNLFIFETGFKSNDYSIWKNNILLKQEFFPKTNYNFLYLTLFKIKMLFKMFVFSKYKHIDIWMVEGVWGIIGIFLRKIGLVKKIIIIHFDYNPKWKLINKICSFSAKYADELWPISYRIPYENKNKQKYLISICDRKIESNKNRNGILYLSSGNHSTHGLDLLFDISWNNNIPVHIVGKSNYLDKLRKKAPNNIIFHGHISGNDLIKISSKCFCGWAIYTNLDKNHFQYYGFPAKYFQYLSYNLPIITTNVAEISGEIENKQVGVLSLLNIYDINSKILKLKNEYKFYSCNIFKFKVSWNDRAKQLFTDLLS